MYLIIIVFLKTHTKKKKKQQYSISSHCLGVGVQWTRLVNQLPWLIESELIYHSQLVSFQSLGTQGNMINTKPILSKNESDLLEDTWGLSVLQGNQYECQLLFFLNIYICY